MLLVCIRLSKFSFQKPSAIECFLLINFTVDSVRAVLSSGFGLASDARLALWGYSGGSLASEWAAEVNTLLQFYLKCC